MAEAVHDVSLVAEVRQRYLTYALSVISSRALPDVRDGLKPVQRRILYTMFSDLALHPDARARKCAKIVGEVMGNYHPHGDAAIYEALVRMAQDFVMRAPLVDGQGNFGSVDGDAAAAYRYTEAKLTAFAEHLLAELKQKTVPMRANFDGTDEEPVVLPAQFPNLLVNGVNGIAVGLATNIPPHNLGEVMKAAIALIDAPQATTAELLNRLKGPDFPLGGKIIASREMLKTIYEEGSGTIKIQAEWKLEQDAKRAQIVVTSVPYGVNKGNLEAAIGTIITERKLPQVSGIVNESNEREGIRLVLELKADADPQVVMAYLYKHTALMQNFSYNMTCLVPQANGQTKPERLGLKAILQHFLDFRLETVRRRFAFELARLQERIHVLDGYSKVFSKLNKAVALIRSSKGKQDAAARLIEAFQLDAAQAEAVLDAALYRLSQQEIARILAEHAEKRQAAAKIARTLAADSRLWQVVRDELATLAASYPERRRSRIIGVDDGLEFDPEAYIVRENTNVILTRDGWVKRIGRLASVEGARVREGDQVIAVLPGSTLDQVVFFTDDGSAYTIRINDIPSGSGYGEPLAKFFRLSDQVRVIGAATTDPRVTPKEADVGSEPSAPHVVVITASGQTMRTPFAPYRSTSTKQGRRYARLADGDRVVLAALVNGERSVLLATASGCLGHVALGKIPALFGAGKGVPALTLEGGDRIIGAALMASGSDTIAIETTRGGVLRFAAGSYPASAPGKSPMAITKRNGFVRLVPPALVVPTLTDLDECP